MTSIPADPSLVLGNIIDPWRVRQLQVIAQLQTPVDLANDRLNNLTMSNYKIKMIFQQMVNLRVDILSLGKIQAEMVVLKAEMADAAIDLGAQVLVAERAIRVLKAKLFKQSKISKQVESPINYDLSTVKTMPLSFDSLKFDVQFFQVQRSADASVAHAESISSHIARSFSESDQASVSASQAMSAHTSTMRQTTTNSVDGTIVITAFATHKQVDVMSPLVLDPIKAVNAWNWTHPRDKLRTNAIEMWRAALLENPLDFGTMQLLSGCAKSSSFVGYVHVLKTERTTQTQQTASVASSVARTIENDMAIKAMSGSYGASRQASESANALLSTARLNVNCSLQCHGIIPSIVASKVDTAVKNLNPDPTQVMTQLQAITNASSTDVNKGMESAAGNATTGAQFITLNNEYLTSTVSALGEETRISNSVIDTTSMMTAFEDYVKKAIEGGCGVPTAYFIKDLTKADVAKCYIRRYYPNGAATQKEAREGQLGTTAEGGK